MPFRVPPSLPPAELLPPHEARPSDRRPPQAPSTVRTRRASSTLDLRVGLGIGLASPGINSSTTSSSASSVAWTCRCRRSAHLGQAWARRWRRSRRRRDRRRERSCGARGRGDQRHRAMKPIPGIAAPIDSSTLITRACMPPRGHLLHGADRRDPLDAVAGAAERPRRRRPGPGWGPRPGPGIRRRRRGC